MPERLFSHRSLMDSSQSPHCCGFFPMAQYFRFAAFFVLFLNGVWISQADDRIDNDIRTILQVGPGGAGSVPARIARQRLVKTGPAILSELLVAMDTQNVVAANWLRTAFDEIVRVERTKPTPQLPLKSLEDFLNDSRHSGKSRRLVLEVLEQDQPGIRDRLLTGWLDDPEFRRDAVDAVLKEGDLAKEGQQIPKAKERFQKAFENARESDQVMLAVSNLKELGVDVDPRTHMGFVTRWELIGPFPAPEMTGFHKSFVPEERIELKAEIPTSDGKTLPWKRHQTDNPLGEVNLIGALGAVDEAVGYAYAELDSPVDTHAELRCSADDNLSVWINGKRVLSRDMWLNGTRLDRFITSVDLQKGVNRVLVKICQGPHHVNPEIANAWSFQVRFCDKTGRAVELRNILPPITP